MKVIGCYVALYVQPQDLLLSVECALNHAAVLLMRTLALTQRSSWPMKLDTSKNIRIECSSDTSCSTNYSV